MLETNIKDVHQNHIDSEINSEWQYGFGTDEIDLHYQIVNLQFNVAQR